MDIKFPSDINEQIQSQLNALQTALKNSQENEIDKNKSEIKRLILEDLIKRYQYQEGLYQFYTQNNTTVKKAIQVLNDAKLYKTTLNVK